MTPYLILDNELETALKFAAQRGVDVKIILPGIPDKKAAYAPAKTHHFECATYLFQTGCIAQIEDDFESTLAKCREVTADTIKKEKLRMKMLGGFMKLIAPLM